MRHPHVIGTDDAGGQGRPPPLLAIAHGSRDPRAAAAVAELLDGVRRRSARQGLPGLQVVTAYLDHAPPSPAQVLGALHGSALPDASAEAGGPGGSSPRTSAEAGGPGGSSPRTSAEAGGPGGSSPRTSAEAGGPGGSSPRTSAEAGGPGGSSPRTSAEAGGPGGSSPRTSAEAGGPGGSSPRTSAEAGGPGGSSPRTSTDQARTVVALPLLLTDAYHSKTDIPSVLRYAAVTLPGLRIRYGETLGPHPLLISAMERRLTQAGVQIGDPGTAVVLAAAGSTDPAATEVISRLASDWHGLRGWYDVVPAFASAASPSPADAVASLRGSGARNVVVASYLLAPGVFADKVRDTTLAAGASAVSGVLAAAPEVADLVLRRYAAASAGITRLAPQAAVPARNLA